jgi:hypothetical protein
MSNLTRANRELFRRTPDETFDSLDALWQRCRAQKESSTDLWHPPQELVPTSDMTLCVGGDGAELMLNDWSFSQLCRLAGVSKDTINRLSSKTASRALQETLPAADKPLQLLTTGSQIRSIHGVAYTRLWNVELLSMLREFAVDFQPPQRAAGSTGEARGTGLYCGEQDLFCFLIDPAGWAEIDGEAFAPGFFVWNSEVGRRSLGIQTFWFQKICRNHIVWDAVEVVEFKRKHTANVHEALGEIRRHVETLVARRDQRRDGFVSVLRKAMQTRLGEDAEEVTKVLAKNDISRTLIKQALEHAEQQGAFTIFSLVDALTRQTQKLTYVGDRTEADQQVAALLALAA